ncbi:tryptophan--tRNA ligase [Candidatus Roizmanbacteria bacterium CG_4_10_14_0_2_um_filter_36_9]|uniref:Tryptophan--tRNA ligase n=1 Tax=Candidatus Roizmanbacteria bacterium CG_4_10_14_0_2_um_filter_36_9 TaxID=1974823 RepID=A0A2M7U595_9BACT|nr:MAG: tryptophan--tRNA ligase [Candidatus Roizmanbacteria bacterium CG_4_10_14_0_2_um_filter_36_9]
MKRILSGITPSSTKGLHLGNYLGMIKPAIKLQNDGQCYYFVANMHGLNSVYNPEQLRRNAENIFIEYLAFGVDPEKTIFFFESDIPFIPYLQTILNNAVTVSELKRMHAYKDKLVGEQKEDSIGMGLFSYPMLMAADILAFDTEVVPVGEDQAQHVEIAREIARTFNNRYGDILTLPVAQIDKNVARVPGIFGKRKMSKSLGNDLPIFAMEDEIKKQIMNIKTDPARIHPKDPGDPSKNVTFTYLDLLNYDTVDLKDRYTKGTISDVEIKKILLSFFLEYFNDARTKKVELLKNKEFISKIRFEGAAKANEVANTVLTRVKNAIGI